MLTHQEEAACLRQPAARLLIGMLAHLQAVDTVPLLSGSLIYSQ